jgi:putative ABC transport system substrate-binding protein
LALTIGRRELIAALGGVAVWPLAARAQQTIRRIGILLPAAADDAEFQARVGAFLEGLQQSGWTIGQNVRIDSRWATTNAIEIRRHAAELAALAPDAILTSSSPALAALQQATRTVPIVFVNVVDPVGSGFVDSLARPGGNTTGFLLFEYSLSAKWLELLKQIAPGVRRAAVVHVPDIAANVAFLHVAEAASASLGMTVTAAGVRDDADIERVLTGFARVPNGGLIVTPSPLIATRRELIIALAARLGLPAIYPFDYFPKNGGLVSYGINRMQHVREAASYVDRILRGANPGELPVQLPTKYELVINLKTAKALGLTIPQSLLVSADEVIE